MADIDLWAALVGFGMPPLIAVVVRGSWPSWARGIVALISCVIAGGLTAYLTGDLTGITPLRAVLVVLFAALGAYRVFWHPSKIAPAIERATDPKPVWHSRPGPSGRDGNLRSPSSRTR